MERTHAAAVAAIGHGPEAYRRAEADYLKAAEAVLALADNMSEADVRYREALLVEDEIHRLIGAHPDLPRSDALKIAQVRRQPDALVRVMRAPFAQSQEGGRRSGQARRQAVSNGRDAHIQGLAATIRQQHPHPVTYSTRRLAIKVAQTLQMESRRREIPDTWQLHANSLRREFARLGIK